MRLVIAPLLLLAWLAGCDREKAPASQGEPGIRQAQSQSDEAVFPTGRLDRSHAGTQAPQALFEDPHGRQARLADFRGRPWLVNLWATWCGPCVVEMPSLDRLAVREEVVLKVLALSQDIDGREAVTAFFAERNFVRLEPYLDPRTDIMRALGVDTLPTTILYDGEGREAWRMTGMADWQSERTARLLAEGGVPLNPAAGR
ncbi:MAG: TlpA family protein disulfide reductase [Sphingosinicella sp.]